ncbi:hypothetical protein CPB83DRAFT_863147 [Crepidotus variabilis]|uniref:Uncharacterized protein n=1 Tax=Crepidotus variabilis TaxID=179855 RepID=A0A9P6E684_9AGAR|nr:hypothetical protein CPB83DRAFT_863147 [Crepidotus variabilis]
MPPKRALDVTDSEQRPSKDVASPTKRLKRDNFIIPQTPVASTSTAPWLSSSGIKSQNRGSTFATPATPYTPFPLHPSDSPSNPFKKKKNVETLPPISSFSKHIALRFQMHRRGVGFQKGGVHRIVQVPLNYTFTHLRALISWLFDTPVKCTNGKGGEEEYLFEVKKSIVAESMFTKPGMIRSGTTTIKLSNTRDPWRKRYGCDLDEEDELINEESETDADEDADEEDPGEWVWQDEEEYTLGHVWITGVRADRGVIYHISPNTQVHITANTTKLPRRRGKSNVPYVFFARGRVYLSHRPLPRPVFATSITHVLSSSPLRPTSSRGKKAVFSKRTSPRKNTTPLHPIEHSPEQADEHLTDEDADGEPDQGSDDDQDDNQGSTDFDENHPFFQSLDRETSTSPRKKSRGGLKKSPVVIDLQDSDEEEDEEQPSPKKRRQVSSPAVILVEDSDEESNHEGSDEGSEEEEELTTESFDRLINPEHWNREEFAFGRYLLSFLDPKGRKYDHIEDDFFEDKKVYDPFENDDDTDDDEEEREEEEEEYVEEDSMHQEVIDLTEDDDEGPTKKATPALTNASSHTSSSLPPSSPFIRGLLSSSPLKWPSSSAADSDASFASTASCIDPLSLSPTSSLKIHPTIIASHYPNKKYSFTPAPPKARKHRVRLERMEKRFERGKKGEYLCAADEPEESRRKGGEEVDELEEDEEDKENAKWVRPKLKPGEIWDPFGDEPEI